MKRFFYGGLIHTMDPGSVTVETHLIDGDRIAATGRRAALSEAAEGGREVDLAVLLPAFIDAHHHFGIAATVVPPVRFGALAIGRAGESEVRQ